MPQQVGSGELALLLPDYSFDPLCNLKGHDWMKDVLCFGPYINERGELDFEEKIFVRKYCLRCSKVSYKEDES